MSQNGERYFVGPPDALDRFALIERRAASGEGEVWRAVESHGTESFEYAVKVIRVDDDALVDRHLEELRPQTALATHLEQPALVAVKEVFVGPPPHRAGAGTAAAGRHLYFVMKWLHGRSLQEALEHGDIRWSRRTRPRRDRLLRGHRGGTDTRRPRRVSQTIAQRQRMISGEIVAGPDGDRRS